MKFLESPPRFLFLTGKGGVGKTSIACAAAVQLASTGRRVLLVSTDPASNVGQVFGLEIGNRVSAIPQVPGARTTEIAAFDEFTSLLVRSELTAGFDHIVFDTASTGHRIRLLQLPGA